MSTDIRKAALKRAIRKLVLAEIAESWSGGGDPLDAEIIAEDLAKARANLDRALDNAFAPETAAVHELAPQPGRGKQVN